jgi:hypothetical protein
MNAEFKYGFQLRNSRSNKLKSDFKVNIELIDVYIKLFVTHVVFGGCMWNVMMWSDDQ